MNKGFLSSTGLIKKKKKGTSFSVHAFLYLRIKWVQLKCHRVQTHQSNRSVYAALVRLLSCRACYLFFNVFLAVFISGQIKCLQAVMPGVRHARLQFVFWLMIISQLCLSGLNTHARGLLLFMSGWTMVQQHLLHRHQFTQHPTEGDKLFEFAYTLFLVLLFSIFSDYA